jgi:hypothetical protein
MMTESTGIWPEFIEWQETAAKMARFYTMSEKEQTIAVCEDWQDDLCKAWADRLEELQDAMHANPVTSWRDVAILGIVALGWQAGANFDGTVEDLDDKHAMDRANGYLIRAVGIRAQREGVSSLLNGADFDRSLPKDAKDKAA